MGESVMLPEKDAGPGVHSVLSDVVRVARRSF
jgi:hypothetical protein